MPDAKSKALHNIRSTGNMTRYCGYSTLSNLFRRGITLDTTEEETYLKALKETIGTTESHNPTCNAAIISLTKYTEEDKKKAATISNLIEKWDTRQNEAIKILIESIREEE